MEAEKCLSQNKKYEQYKNINIFAEKDVRFKCLGHQSILSYAKQNSATTIYIYQHNKPQQGDNAVYIKQSDFVTYAQERKSIKNQWLCKAFLNKDIDVENIKNNATAEQKGEIIQSLSGEEVLNYLSPE
jgi:hypothetical protein